MMHHTKMIFQITLLLIFFSSSIYASDIPDFPESHTVFSGEIRSVICSGSGFASVKKGTDPEDGKKRAMEVARRFVLRKSNDVILRKLAVFKDGFGFELEEFQPGEYVKILSEKEVKPPVRESKDMYGVRIIAEVCYKLPDFQDHEKMLSYPELPLTVRVWSKKQSYIQGEKIIFYMRGNRDFYARMIDISPRGEMVQLLPNKKRKNHFYKAGVTYLFPDPVADDFDLKVSPPFGEETVLLYAAERPLRKLPFSENSGTFGIIDGTEREISEQIRKPESDSKEFSAMDFFESRWLVRTSGK